MKLYKFSIQTAQNAPTGIQKVPDNTRPSNGTPGKMGERVQTNAGTRWEPINPDPQ